jgi:hypothetical protein
MLPIVILVISIVAALIHIWRDKHPRSSTRVIEILLLYFLVIDVGLGSLIAFSGHAFQPDQIAKDIGWPAGNPFQLEVAMANLAFGVLGVLCIWIRRDFWTATVIGFAVWLAGNGYGHIYELAAHDNHSQYNSGPILYTDIGLPIAGLILLYLLWRKVGSSRIGYSTAVAPLTPVSV